MWGRGVGGSDWCERVTCEVLCQHRPGGTDETHESKAGVPAEIRNLVTTEYKPEALPGGATCSERYCSLQKLRSGNLTCKQQNRLPITF